MNDPLLVLVSVPSARQNFRRRAASDRGVIANSAKNAVGHTGGVPAAFARDLERLMSLVRVQFAALDRRYMAALEAGMGHELSPAMDRLLDLLEALESITAASLQVSRK